MRKNLIRFLKHAAMVTACGALFMAPLANTARAEAYTERTAVTFNNDVEIPGHMLPAGTYIFQKAPDMGAALNLDVIQIYDATGTQLIATANTVPAILPFAPSHPKVELNEAPAGTPARVHEFVFEGSTYAHRFVYR